MATSPTFPTASSRAAKGVRLSITQWAVVCIRLDIDVPPREPLVVRDEHATDGCPHSQATPEALRVSVTSRRRKMRNLLRRSSLLAAALLLATALLSSGFSALPAGATTLYRRPIAH